MNAPSTSAGDSFRDGRLTELESLVVSAGFSKPQRLAGLLADVIDKVQSYTEEGVRLFPELLVVESLPTALLSVELRVRRRSEVLDRSGI